MPLDDPIFSLRLKELLTLTPDPTRREIELLKVGRHFRFISGVKVIIGRNRKENEFLEKWRSPEDGWARTQGYPGPLTLILGSPLNKEEWERIARLCLAYSDAPLGNRVSVQLGQGERRFNLTEVKGEKEDFKEWMVG